MEGVDTTDEVEVQVAPDVALDQRNENGLDMDGDTKMVEDVYGDLGDPNTFGLMEGGPMGPTIPEDTMDKKDDRGPNPEGRRATTFVTIGSGFGPGGKR